MPDGSSGRHAGTIGAGRENAVAGEVCVNDLSVSDRIRGGCDIPIRGHAKPVKSECVKFVCNSNFEMNAGQELQKVLPGTLSAKGYQTRSEEHTSELQSLRHL